MDREKGQVALLLILAMTVMGVVSASLASKSITNLRSTEIDQDSAAAFKAAEAGLERAILSKTNVDGTLSSGNISYNATYQSAGSAGFVTTTPVEAGDVVSVSLAGATGVSSVNIYWNNNAAVKASDIRGNSATAEYGVRYLTSDPADGSRPTDNKFTATSVPDKAGFSFLGSSFAYRLTVPINLTVSPTSKILRVLVLYAATKIGVEPIGGTLVDGQMISISAVGKSNLSSSKISQQSFTERLPGIFDNVIYTRGVISQ